MKPVHFTHVNQIKSSRPAFDETCLITTQNFADLVRDDTFPEDAHCQVERKDSKGVLCGHEHRKGWVGRCKDGREGLICRSGGPTFFQDHADCPYPSCSHQSTTLCSLTTYSDVAFLRSNTPSFSSRRSHALV